MYELGAVQERSNVLWLQKQKTNLAVQLMYKYKLQIIITIIFGLFILGGCSGQIFEIKPKAESGVLDLTQVQLGNDILL